MMLACSGLNVEIPGRRLVEGLGFELNAGEFVAVLGENGAGKTLTLHTLAGLRRPQGGSVLVQGRRIETWPRRALARTLGLLAQHGEDPFPSTVLETALIGRHPHIRSWRWENEEDIAIARAALAAVGMDEFAERQVQTLSGGERRRLAIATVLAQDPRIFVLDEPLNHLDPHHQLQVLELFRARANEGRTVIATVHDATLAARFSDRALLLFGNGTWMFGPSTEVITGANLSSLYRTPVEQIEHRGRRIFVGQ